VDEESRVQLLVVVAPDVPKTLFLDETFIHRILMNLLSNALVSGFESACARLINIVQKFTRAGYIMLSIEVRDDVLVVIVKDTGCGLDPAFIPDMWTPFKQGEVRGSARGTGLGLSIIKQLLHRMKGSIDVESQYMHSEDVGPELSGTTFTVQIPLQSTILRPESPSNNDRPRIAILSKRTTRATDGIAKSWETFGFSVELVPDVASLAHSQWEYVWAGLDYLNEDVSQFEHLLRKKKLLVLVPYDTHDSLEGLPSILSAPNFVMLPKPLIWHTFERRILASKHRRQSTAPSQALRFAPEVEVINGETKAQWREESPLPQQTILIVEDNSVRATC
jgi:hypothetical protein